MSEPGDIERWTLYYPTPAASRADPGRTYEKADRYAEGWERVEVVPAVAYDEAVRLLRAAETR